MKSHGGSSTSGHRFDPLKLLSEIQAEPTASSAPAESPRTEALPTQQDDDDDDFMSDKFLATNEDKQPLTYTDKRRRLEAHHSRKAARKSLSQREEEARQEGLDRDLLAEAEIIAGGGTLPPEAGDGTRRWDRMQTSSSRPAGLDPNDGEPDQPTDAAGRQDGTSKAMKMMLAMGYRRGEALGRRMQSSDCRKAGDGMGGEEVEEEEEEEEQEEQNQGGQDPPGDTDAESLDSDEERAVQRERDESDAREEDEYLTGGVASAPFALRSDPAPVGSAGLTEPLRPDQRWLGVNRRAGIGMIPPTPPDVAAAVRTAASSQLARDEAHAAEDDFRTRVSRAHQERHEVNLLTRARKTLVELDRAAGIEYSPLWLDAHLYRVLSGRAIDTSTQTLDERIHSDPAFKDAVQLLQHAFTAQQPEQNQEAHAFCTLDTSSQLGLVTACLRSKYAYCLFCGCSYTDAHDLAANCPGESEDDHS